MGGHARTAGTGASHRVAAVLRMFLDERDYVGVSEAARHLGLSKAVVHRVMLSLEDEQMLEFDPVRRRYKLGALCTALGARALRNADIRTAARPLLERLVAETRESASLSVLVGMSRVCVDQVQSPHQLTMRVDIGARHALHAGPSANVMLAYLGPELIEEIITGPLEQLTPYTLTDPAELRKRLAAIVRDGVAISFRDRREEAGGVAAPVFGVSGAVCGAIGLAGPAIRFTPEFAEQVAPRVKQVAEEVSRQLGWRPGGSPVRAPAGGK